MGTRKDMVHGAKRSSPIQWIDRNVDIKSYSDNKDDYIMYMREKKAIIELNRKLCSMKYTTLEKKMWWTGENNFATPSPVLKR